MSVVANVAINVDSSGAVSKLRQVQTQATATERAAQSLTKGVEAVNAAAAKTGREMQVAANGMRFFTDAAGKARKENGQFVTTAEAAAAGIRKQGQAAQGASGAVNSLAKAASLLSAAFVIKAGLDLAAQTNQFIRMNGALKAVTGSAAGASAALGSVYRVQALTGQSSTELAQKLTAVLISAKGTTFEGAKAAKTFEQLAMVTVAYGGSNQQAEKALLAFSQMMSKGKVSAEELRGQLGDALPGAVELFRQAYKGGSVSMKEFSKLMDSGKLTVNDFAGINDVLKQKLDAVYGAGFSDYLAKQAKFNQAMDKLKLIGGTVAGIIATALLPAATELVNFLATSNPKVLGFASAVAAIATGAILAAAAIGTLQVAVATLGLGAGLAKGGQALLGLAKSGPQGAALATVIAAGLGAGAVIGVGKLTDEFGKGIKKMQGMIKDAGKFDLSVLGGDKSSADTPDSLTDKELKAQSAVADQFRSLIKERLELETKLGNVNKDRISQLEAEAKLAKDLYRINANAVSGPNAALQTGNLIFGLQSTLAQINKDYEDVLAEIVDIGVQGAAISNKLLGKITPNKSPLTQSIENTKLEIIDADKELEKLLSKLQDLGGIDPVTGAARKLLGNARGNLANIDPVKVASEKLTRADVSSLTNQNTELLNAGEYLTTLDQLILKYGEDWAGLDPVVKAHLTDLAAQNEALKNSGALVIQTRINALKKEIKDLTNIGNIAVKVADGIGTAFGQAFQGLISGSMSAREALGSFFKSVGDMFISMATEIIAKQMTMIILQTILKALGAVSGAAGGGSGGDLSKVNHADFFKYAGANGATFSNGIAAFANGGIVGNPTLFKFADGGTTRTGLMGEAGPEAIMPLSRDGSGRLGVNASGLRDAMAGGNSGGGGGTTLNMSFQTSTINGVEYVSRDQLEAAMAQTRRDATRDGAKKGMSMTIDRLQQSPQIRSRVGMR